MMRRLVVPVFSLFLSLVSAQGPTLNAPNPASQESKEPKEQQKGSQEKSKTSEEIDKAAEELWQKALAAKGGLDILKTVKTRITTAQSTWIFADTPAHGKLTTVVVYPDKISSQFTVGSQTVSRTLVGDHFWIYNTKANQVTTMPGAMKSQRPPDQAIQLKTALETDPIAFFIRGVDSSAKRKLLEPSEGMPGVEIILKSGRVFKAYFDSQTSLLKKLIYTIDYHGEVIALYADYQTVAGIQVPFKRELFRGIYRTEEELITEFKINAPVSEDTFRVPYR